MESFSLIPVTLATILTSFSNTEVPHEQAVIKTHLSPEIAGLWQLNPETIKAENERNHSSNLEKPNGDTELEISSANTVVVIDSKNNSELKSVVANHQELVDIDSIDSLIITESKNIKVVNSFTKEIEQNTVDDVNTIPQINSNQQAVNQVAKKKSCIEYYNFAADNKLITTSGSERTFGEYLYYQQGEGLPLLALNTLYDNNEPDCSGLRVDQTGDVMLVFVDYQPSSNTMRWCADDQGTTCNVTLTRLLP